MWSQSSEIKQILGTLRYKIIDYLYRKSVFSIVEIERLQFKIESLSCVLDIYPEGLPTLTLLCILILSFCVYLWIMNLEMGVPICLVLMYVPTLTENYRELWCTTAKHLKEVQRASETHIVSTNRKWRQRQLPLR